MLREFHLRLWRLDLRVGWLLQQRVGPRIAVYRVAPRSEAARLREVLLRRVHREIQRLRHV
jgi:hypothetical protein